MTESATRAGRVLLIEGDVAADDILHPRHHGLSQPSELRRNCLAGVAGAMPFDAEAGWSILVCSGSFAVGLPRPPVSAALACAGIEVVIASAFAPMFVENSLNAGALLPVVARVDQAQTGGEMEVTFTGDEAIIAYPGFRVAWPARLPGWALAGRSWTAELQRRAAAAGGLDALRRSLAPSLSPR